MKNESPRNCKTNPTMPPGRNAKFFFAIVILAIAVCLVIYFAAKAAGSSNSKEQATTTTDAVTAAHYINKVTYVIKTYEGKIAVFDEDTTTDVVPLAVYETYVSSLPESDRQALDAGITVSTDAELQQIIEDLTS